MKLHSKAIPVLSCVLLLSACGGGGGSEPVAPPIAVNQPPSLTVEAEVSVVEGNLEVAVASGTDPENQSLSYSISGGADSALFSVSNEGEISFVSAADFEAPADSDVDNSYELTLELADSRGGTDSAQIVVTVTNALEGRVVDGPLSGSAVFLDLNNNLIADAGEPTATANAQGYYALPEPADTLGARLVALGGTDIATNIELADLALIADLPANLASAITISPISSVIAGVEGDDAKAAVLAALGINVSLDDFLAMDIWALAEANNDDAKALQRINQQIALIMTTVQSLGQATTQEELRSLAENAADAVAAQITTNGAINLESTSQLVAVVTASLPNTSAVSALVVGAVAENIADINKLLADESANPTSDAAAEFVQATQTTLLSEVADVVSGVSSLVEFVAETAVSNLFGNSDFYNAQVDTDSDGISNLLDNDDDGDGVADGSDAFPLDASETLDSDADQIGNNADLDDDNDGVADELDAFPLNPTESEDFDEDGIGNNADLDNDNDGVADLNDAFPFDSTETLDTDGDQIGNNADTDDDGDGVADVDDFFPLDATRSEESDGALDNGDLLVFKDGGVGSIWDAGINAFDSAINWGECNQDGGAGCPSIGWEVVTDAERGDVLQVSHSAAGNMAGLFFKASQPVNLADYSAGAIEFDIKVVSGDSKITMKLDCVYPCTSGDKALGSKGASGWESVSVSLSSLSATGLVLTSVDTGLVIWATDAAGTVFLLDNVRFTGIADGATPPTGGSGPVLPPSSSSYEILPYGAGSISDTFNLASYRCAVDYGNWIYNAGVVEPAIAACDENTRIPSGTPTKLYPQLTGEALNRPVPTHKWWGSVGFVGEMRDGGAAYITPDPIRARISPTGARINGIPGGFKTFGNFPRYEGPVPFDEVFEGVAIANSVHNNMDAYLKDHSDGSVTVQWKTGSTAVMDATFVHGSPYVYFKLYEGEALLRTLRTDSGEKGIFYNQENHLGVWTYVAGIRNNILISGEGVTSYENISSDEITISNASKEFTLSYLPTIEGDPSNSMSNFFAARARNLVAAVNIDYSVDRATNMVTVNHSYVDAQGQAVDTIVGLHPLHWKNSAQATSQYKIRSARGMIKFSETQGFSYQLPFTGVLPTMPSIADSYDQNTLESLVSSFVNAGESSWINATDTYWSGKAYGKVAETAALAQSIGMDTEAGVLIDWLKVELADWFTAETDGNLDINKYFVYDENWDALFGIEEAYGSHQRMADHHFHYGYFVRAAAEICRVDVAWCGADQYGPMIELLIRDYAGDDSEEMFPKMRNFDPANGFSWADGKGDAVQGNNNESTSEAANAYGAIVLYGLATGQDDLVAKGMYMHASTSAAFWQYWNNIDGYNNLGADYNNFPAGYDKITTSIIWGSGADFSTWFSPKYAHILGIQGLPSSPLILYVGQYADYMQDYVSLGMTESSNGKPSGLGTDEWTDLWWNLWAMTDADAALTDYNSVGSNYAAEAGESKAHTYHWLHTFSKLGHLKTGTGELTADYPGALAFDAVNGGRTYVVYNFSDQPITVTYSDGQQVTAAAKGFTLEQAAP